MRVGFACMRLPQPEEFKINTTTVTHLRTLERPRDKLEALARGNALHVRAFVESVAREEPVKRIVRIGSGMWPMYDHPDFTGYDLSVASAHMRHTRALARAADVRLSFHPDQFNALASTRTEVVARTIETLDIAARQAKLLGATNCVIHCWGKGGPRAFRENFQYLSDDAQRVLVVENDEFGTGTEALLDSDIGLPIVLDPHHHWVNTGRWPDEQVFEAVRHTWPQDRNAKIHYSYPRNNDQRSGWPKPSGNRSLDRAHSDLFSNNTVTDFMLHTCSRLDFDILCEAKSKDIARDQVVDRARQLGLA